jgi:hypothetical protein
MVARDVGTGELEYDAVTGYPNIYARELLGYAREKNLYTEIVWAPRFAVHVYTGYGDRLRAAEVAKLDAVYDGSLMACAIRDAREGSLLLAPYTQALDAIGRALYLIGGGGRDKTVSVHVHGRVPRIVINVETYDGHRNAIGTECLDRLYRINGVRDVIIGSQRAPGLGIYLWVSCMWVFVCC